jgi:Protein of unknown function (DUF2971)
MTVDSPYVFAQPEGLLAHYTSAAVACEHVLPTGQIRLGHYGNMRDPAESQDPRLAMGFSGDRTDEEANRAYDDLLAIVKEIRDSMRVLSLTREVPAARDSFGCCWARPRMWERYGDVHRGACLVFDAGRLRNAIHAQMPEQAGPNEPPMLMGSVRYTPAGIANSSVVGISDDDIFDTDRVRDAVARYIDAHYEDFYLLKTDDFASEWEYRTVVRGDETEYAYVDYRNALVAVVVGLHFPEWQLPGAALRCESAGVELRKMHWGGSPFALHPRGTS